MIFSIDFNDNIHYNQQKALNGDWVSETKLVAYPVEQIAVGRNADGRLELFGITPRSMS